MLHTKLSDFDKDIYKLIKEEKTRQKENIELIASENFTSLPVLECLGSILTNKYSEGQPGKRYYGGNEVIDKIEILCKKRALEAFNLDENIWGVNVQPYSGSPANFAVYTALLNPGDKIMGLDLSSGGHLSHGFKTEKKKISATSIYFESESYHVKSDGYIDYEELEEKALKFKPNLIICGASAYPRDFNYQKFREICNKINCLLMADIAHISGLVATNQMKNPFEFCDIVTSTTHKTLRGPRSGIIFFKKEFEKKINDSVFPGLQGGPHNHQIAGLAVQLKEVKTIEFKNYIKKIIHNAKYLAEKLKEHEFILSSNGTDNHLILINLKNFGITGSKMEKICELVNISLNKNTIPGDKSALNPSGIRIGLSCMTTRNINKEGLDNIAKWLKKCVTISIRRQNTYGKKIKNFLTDIENDNEINNLKEEIINYSKNLYFYN